MTLRERLVSLQPIWELRRRALKAKRKQKIWTEEEFDYFIAKALMKGEDINEMLSQFNLNQRKR